MTLVQECPYEPPHSHEFPDDWVFGGPSETDPRADERWTPTTYIYLNDRLDPVWTTQVPVCLDQALDEFTKYRESGAAYLQSRVRGGKLVLEPFRYDPKTDTVFSLDGE